MQGLPRGLRRYLVLLHLACLVLLCYEIAVPLKGGLPAHPDRATAFAVIACIILSYVCEHTTLQIKGAVSHNLASVTYIGVLLVFAPPFPMLIAMVAAAISQARQPERSLAKRGFNVVHPMLMVGLTGLICSIAAAPSSLLHESFPAALPGLVLLLVVYSLVDVGMMLTLMTLLGNGQVWWQAYRHTLLPELAAGTFGIIGAVLWHYHPLAVALLGLPLTALRLTFRANAAAEERAQALRRRGKQLETVLAVGRHLRLQQSRPALLQAVTEAAHTILDAQVVTGYLRDEEDPSLLRRIALAPSDASCPGPAHLEIGTATTAGAADELRVPIGLDASGVAGLLLAAGVPEATSTTDGDVLAILATQTAIALQNAYLHERALALAARDTLTELLNRRAIQDRVEEEVGRALRGHHPLSLLMLDLDDFSTINATFGHQAGDLTLCTVARALGISLRDMDVPARYGGDEFVVLLPETTLEQALVCAERLRGTIAALQVIDSARAITVTASVGVATLPRHGRSAEELLRSADQATYAAKHAGKGRVALPEDASLALDRDPMVLAAQLAHANMATVAALAAAVDAKDPYTQGHSLRVSRYAVALAEAMELPDTDIARIRLAGQLHDVGKIGVPDAVLAKPGKLSPEEYQAIQQHPVIGERMLAGVPFLREILPAVRHHHERWDGKGYPDGLKGQEIHQDAAILAVADAFDAMSSSRPYRSALPVAEARRRILEGAGTQFDPQVVRAFEQAVAAGTFVVPDQPWPDELHQLVGQAS